jgi:hypothetical protein
MTARQHHIGWREFVTTGSKLTEEEESRRQAALVAEFIQAVPAAGRLKGSDLFVQRHHTDAGCRLEYYLVQRPQYPLNWDADADAPPADVESDNRFNADAESVAAQCSNAKTRLALAVSPALTFRELNQRTPEMLDIRTLRALYRRRARELVVPTPEGELVLNLPAQPNHLPTGLTARVTTLVKGLNEGTVDLQDLALAANAHRQAPSAVAIELTFPAAMTATRPDDLSDVAKLALVDAIDDAIRIELDVEINFDWASGEPSEVKLLKKRAPVAER